MRGSRLVAQHSLSFFLLALFVVVGAVDLLNLDSAAYKGICTVFLPITGAPCTDYYDLPIWTVYLSVAILAALYYVHAEIKTSNKHLAAQKK